MFSSLLSWCVISAFDILNVCVIQVDFDHPRKFLLFLLLLCLCWNYILSEDGSSIRPSNLIVGDIFCFRIISLLLTLSLLRNFFESMSQRTTCLKWILLWGFTLFVCLVYFKCTKLHSDIRLLQNFTLSDFQAKTFALSVSPNFNSFSDKNTAAGSNGRDEYHQWAIMQNMIFDSVFEVDSVLENKSNF